MRLTVAVYESFNDLPESLRQTCSAGSTETFQLTIEWFENLHKNVFSGITTPRIYSLEDNAGINLGALFCHAVPGRRELKSLTNFYSLEYGVSGPSGDNPEINKMLFSYVLSEGWTTLDFSLLYEPSPLKSAFDRMMQSHGYYSHYSFQYENWFRRRSSSEETFEDYYNSLSSRTRNTIKRKTNKLSREHEYSIELFLNKDEELERAIADYTTIYNNSWKNPEPYESFMPSMIRLAADRELLTLGILYVDQTPAAAQLWLHEKNRSIIYKLAYDESFKNLSVGSILSRRLFEDAFSQHAASEIDYGVGSEAYKREWLNKTRRLVRLTAHNKKKIPGLVRIADLKFRRFVKKVIRRKTKD